MAAMCFCCRGSPLNSTLPESGAVIWVKYWFERLEMQSWWKKKVEELSKGMQQKVGVQERAVGSPRR